MGQKIKTENNPSNTNSSHVIHMSKVITAINFNVVAIATRTRLQTRCFGPGTESATQVRAILVKDLEGDEPVLVSDWSVFDKSQGPCQKQMEIKGSLKLRALTTRRPSFCLYNTTPLRPRSDMQQKTKLLRHKARIGLELHLNWICQHDVQQVHHLGIKCISWCHPSLL